MYRMECIPGWPFGILGAMLIHDFGKIFRSGFFSHLQKCLSSSPLLFFVLLASRGGGSKRIRNLIGYFAISVMRFAQYIISPVHTRQMFCGR